MGAFATEVWLTLYVGSARSATSQPSSGGRARSDAHTYAIDRFQGQNQIDDDGTLHGRTLSQPSHPRPDARVALYEVRAARAVASFDAAFGGGKLSEKSGARASGAGL
ncbi:hypothetical protein VTG60DRAFT_2521 [Thermothelomyces hinnuleus]